MGISRDTSVFAVEIGNTNTHTGSVDITALTCSGRKDMATAMLLAKPDLIAEHISDDNRNVPWVIAGGRNGLASSLERVIQKHDISPITHLRLSNKLPLTFKYDNSGSLGADRIANAIYAAIGVRIKDLPITPEKVLEGLRRRLEDLKRGNNR